MQINSQNLEGDDSLGGGDGRSQKRGEPLEEFGQARRRQRGRLGPLSINKLLKLVQLHLHKTLTAKTLAETLAGLQPL